MISIPIVGKEITQKGIILCHPPTNGKIAVRGYHLYAEDEQKNPHVLVLKDEGTNMICIPTSPNPAATTALFFSEPLYLRNGTSLTVTIVEVPKMAPVKIWGTVWVS